MVKLGGASPRISRAAAATAAAAVVGPSAGRCIIDFMLLVDAGPTTWNLKKNCTFANTFGIILDHVGIIWDRFGICLGSF